MKITRIETIPVRVPIRAEFQIQGSLGSHTESPFVVLKVHTDEGITGLGEVSCTPIWSGEDAVTAVHLIRSYLEPALAGEDPRDIERLTMKMRRALANNPFTKSGIEIALWDIIGKSVGLPVYRLPGGAVFHSLIVHREDDLPIQVEDRYVAATAAPGYLRQDFTRTTPNEYLTTVAPLQTVEHFIRAEIPTARIRGMLGMAAAEPCLVIHRRTWSGGRPVSVAHLHHPGSRYELMAGARPEGRVTGHPGRGTGRGR